MSLSTFPIVQDYRLVRRAVTQTPGLLMAGLGAIWLATALFFLAVSSAVEDHRQGMETVAVNSAPSIDAAQTIKTNLAIMHGQYAKDVLGKAGTDRYIYQESRREVAYNLVKAAKNITYDAEWKHIQTMIDALGDYEGAFARLPSLRVEEADVVLHKVLFPAADALDKVNRDELDKGYASAQKSSQVWTILVLLGGLVLLGLLGTMQVFLYRRTHRLLNPGLVGATGVTAVFLLYALIALPSEAQHLKVLKEDAYDSIHALRRARADAYGALADARLVRNKTLKSDPFEQRFHEKVKKLVSLPKDMTRPQLITLVIGVGRPEEFKKVLPPAFQGYLADELRNITFAGEQKAAVDMLRAFLQYLDTQDEVLRDERAPQGSADGAFDQFDAALRQTIKINQDAFDRARDDGNHTLQTLREGNPLAALGIVLMAYLGLRPRMREYTL